MLKIIICSLALICGVFATEARADDSAPCTTTATGPYFTFWGGGTYLKITVQCEAPVSSIQITGAEWLVDYDDPRYTDVGASGISKTCSNVTKCELVMNIGYPYSVPGRTSVTTWSGNSSYPSGSAFVSATYDPYP